MTLTAKASGQPYNGVARIFSCIGRGPTHIGSMTHTVRGKQKLLARVRRIRGQVEAIERALDAEAGCEQIMHLIAGVRGATAGLMAEVVEDHVRTHLVDAEQHPGALNVDAAEQLLDVVRTYLK
jgi:FrmR/RcnR family transcriptional regulator, repressor of frmRAB operon